MPPTSSVSEPSKPSGLAISRMDENAEQDRWRWAEALAMERVHGGDAPRRVAERVGGLAPVCVERFRQTARRYERLLTDGGWRDRGDSVRQRG